MMKKIMILFLVLGLVLMGCNMVQARGEYPSKPITWVVPFGTGGGSDQFARMMEKQIEEISDTEIVVVNIPGAKTAVGLNHLLQQPADGYTIFGATTDSIINMVTGVSPFTLEDISVVAKVQHNVDMWFIRSDEDRFSNFNELIAYARENPRQLSIATTGLNGADALTIHQIEKAKEVKFEVIPFNQPGERYSALAGGHVDILHEQPGDVLSFLDSDKYKPIISMTENRVRGFTDVPSTVEKEMDLTAGYWRGVWVKNGTPQEAVDHLLTLISEAVKTEQYKEYEKRKYLHLRKGLLIGEDFAKFMEKEYEYYNKVMN